jgi:DNA gyrase subunit A
MAEQIINVEYVDEMQQSYLDYSLSVIVGRAIPDLRSGLKPVHTRILYDMYKQGLRHERPYKKSAHVVGSTMAKYHPHGESIYGALVGLTQDFRKNAPLVDGHGNMGSIEELSFAASRYTECRLERFTEDVMLSDLDKDSVDFVKNYDGTETEPSVLPAKIPMLLVNGGDGIAVGLTSNIPPHSLSEVVDASIAVLKNPDITTAELMQFIPAPDFPTGGAVVNAKDLPAIYESGEGKLRIRGKIDVEELKGGKKRLIVSEIPFTMIGAGMSKFLNDVIDLAEDKTLPEVVDVSNQTSKAGVRLVIELKKDADVEHVKNVLFKKTKLEDTFGVHMLAINNGKPLTLGLKDILTHHVDFRYECETRKYNSLLKKELAKQEVQEGLIKACDIIDLIIEILRGAKNVKDAKACLMNGDTSSITFKNKTSQKNATSLSFTDMQAQAILDMRLQKLIGLELSELKAEHKRTTKNIATYQNILDNRDVMTKLIIDDLERIKKEYGRPRRTTIEDVEEVVIKTPVVKEQPLMMVMDKFGYTKTIDINTYEKNKAAVLSEAQRIVDCVNISKVCIFTHNGQMHQVKVMDVPHGKLRDKGTPIDNISNYSSANENIIFMCDEKFLVGKKLLFTTKNGMMKKVSGEEFVVSKRTIAATKLLDNDEIISIQFVEDKHNIVMSTKNSVLLKFTSSEVPEKKKGAVGVRGIKLGKNDYVDDIYIYEDGVETKIVYRDKPLVLNRLKMSKRDTLGTKQR